MIPPLAAGFTPPAAGHGGRPAAPPGDLGVSLVGQTLLYWWPDDGWQQGAVVPASPGPVRVRGAPFGMLTRELEILLGRRHLPGVWFQVANSFTGPLRL
jgi:hypothetical protein